jgi:hypothetical protein
LVWHPPKRNSLLQRKQHCRDRQSHWKQTKAIEVEIGLEYGILCGKKKECVESHGFA